MLEVNSHTIADPHVSEDMEIGLFPKAAAGFNHSCHPNVDYLPDPSGGLRFFTVAEVPAGSELGISYSSLSPLLPQDQRGAELMSRYHFECECVRCNGHDQQGPKQKRSAPRERKPRFDFDRLLATRGAQVHC